MVQATVLNRFAICGAKPDLLLICVSFFGLFAGKRAGLESGFVAGLLTDLFSLDYFGINMLVYGTVGFFAGMLNSSFIRESKRTQALIVFLCVVFSMCLHFTLVLAFSRTLGLNLSEYMTVSVMPTALYTSVVSVPLFIKFIQMYHLKEQEDLL